MPLLKRKALHKVVEPVNDDDEVFVCEITGELFRKYDDFFNRTMLLSSTVWCCAMTGRMNLTYRDALESERSAKRTVKTFPAALKGPILLIASHTKRTAIHDLAGDVHGYAKDVFFKGETVYTRTGDPETIREAKIVRVVINGSPSDHNPSRLIYHVESLDGGTPVNYSVRGEAIIRKRNSLSREKCKLFLKQHVELGANQMLCVKKESLEQFVTSSGCTDDIVFYGQKPEFEVSKKLQSSQHPRKGVVKTPNIANQNPTKLTDKDKKQMEPSNKKQQSMEKYLKQSAEADAKKEALLEAKQKRLDQLAEQMVLAKELLLAEKELLLRQVALALKDYSAIKEDLELTDQRVMPPAREVRTLIGEEHFSDFVFILEFLNTFSDLLSAEITFPQGITMELLERALLLKELDGPLSGILQMLLRTIFEALKDVDTSKAANLEPRCKYEYTLCVKHFSTKLTDLPMDSTTVSELLRLHISAYKHPTYYGDACFILIRDHPHIMRTLKTQTVFQLSTKSVIEVICALIHQLLVTDEVLSRVEKAGAARMQFRTNQLEQRRLTAKTISLKQVAENSMKRTLASHVGQMPDDELDLVRKKLKHKLTKELAQIETDAFLKMKELKNKLKHLNNNYNLYQVNLGSDRGYRNYWQFQSIPGLFVEHDRKSIGCCLESVTVNIPELAHITGKDRKNYITKSILKCAGNTDGLLEKEEDIYEKLLFRGRFLLEQSNKIKKDTLLPKKSTHAEANNVPAAHPTNRELFMCTGDEKNCPVHHPVPTSNHQAKWSYYATRQELDALIKSLNRRGRRERSLRETLILYRDSIEAKIDLCPIEKLSMQENDRTMMLASMLQPQQNQPEPVTVQSELLETTFRESLLEMERRITVGCLGKLHVNSIGKWRNAIIKRSYDPQIDGKLKWGPNQCDTPLKGAYVKKPHQQSASDESEEEQIDKIDLTETVKTDVLTQKEDPLQDPVRSMASALVQVEQSIDIKFFKYPFGAKKNCRDPEAIKNWQCRGQDRLLYWEDSLMRATSFSQLFLHYHVLYDAIRWGRSFKRATCMVCRLKAGASVSLLCDECNRICHIDCLKPKLKKKLEGDWCCMLCRPQDHKPNHTATDTTIKYDDTKTDESEQDSQDEDDSASESLVDEFEPKAESSTEYEDYENDSDEEEKEEETKPKIIIHKEAGVKKVNSSRSAPRKAHKPKHTTTDIIVKYYDTTTDESEQDSQDEDDSASESSGIEFESKAESEQDSQDEDDSASESSGIEFEPKGKSSTEEYENDIDEKEKEEETKPKIIIHKGAGVKKVNSSRSAPRKAPNQTQSLQRHSSRQIGRHTVPKIDERTKKSTSSENMNRPSTGKRSLDTGTQKLNTSDRSRRTARNQEVGTVQNQRHPPTKRTREREPKKEGYAKKSKLSENISSPSGGRRSLRLSTKEAS